MNTFLIAEECGRDVSSRAAAARLRREVARAAEVEVVYLDFKDVRTISDSFADELFAVLVCRFGFDWFRERIRVSNLDELTRVTILDAIASRIGKTDGSGAAV